MEYSIWEIEVIISVVIILSLSKAGSNKVESEWKPCDSYPDSHSEINNPSLKEELIGTSVKEVEEPLLGCIWSMVPDLTSCISWLLIKVFFSVPCSVLHLWNSHTFTVHQSHVLWISQLIMCQCTSYYLFHVTFVGNCLFNKWKVWIDDFDADTYL